MADNVMGGDNQVSLPMNIDFRLDDAASNAGALANQLDEVIKDMETINSLTSDTSDRLKEIVQGTEQEGTLLQQLIGYEQELRSISEQRLMTLQQSVLEYEKMEQIVGRISEMAGGSPNAMNDYRTSYSTIGSQMSMGPTSGTAGAPLELASAVAAGTLASGRISNANISAPNYNIPQGGGVAPIVLPEIPNEDNLKGSSPGANAHEGPVKKMMEGNGNAMEEEFLPTLLGNLAGRLPQGGMLGRLRELGLSGKTSIGGIPISMGEVAGGLEGAGVLGAGYAAYQGIGDLLRQGQQYTALTGGTGVMGAMGYNAQAFLSGLNPLLGFGQAKQIIQTGLQQGYGGTALQGQYTNFAMGAAENYGISPQESMGMFQSAVVQAGASLQSLSSGLSSLASAAQGHAGSFQQMTQAYGTNLQALAGVGAGAEAPTVASELSQMFQKNPATRGINLGTLLNSPQGQQLLATQLHTSVTGLYSTLQGMNNKGLGGAATESNAFTGAIRSLLSPTLTHGHTRQDINNAAWPIWKMLQGYGFNISENQAALMANQLFNGQPAIAPEQRVLNAALGKPLTNPMGGVGNELNPHSGVSHQNLLNQQYGLLEREAMRKSPELNTFIHRQNAHYGGLQDAYVKTAGGQETSLNKLLMSNGATPLNTWNALEQNRLQVSDRTMKNGHATYGPWQSLSASQGLYAGVANPAQQFGSPQQVQVNIKFIGKAAQLLTTENGMTNHQIGAGANRGSARANQKIKAAQVG